MHFLKLLVLLCSFSFTSFAFADLEQSESFEDLEDLEDLETYTSCSNSDYWRAYNSGKKNGYSDGYRTGQTYGYKKGKSDGYKSGYKSGYSKATGDYDSSGGGFCAFIFRFDGVINSTKLECSRASDCNDVNDRTVDLCQLSE